MKDYLIPSVCEKNSRSYNILLGSNDLPSEKTPEVIAQSVLDFAISVVNDNLQVTISNCSKELPMK